MDVKVPTIDSDLGQLSTTLIALRKSLTPGLRDATLKMALELSGDPGNLSSVRAKVNLISMRASGGTLRGQAEVLGLSEAAPGVL